MPEGFLFVFNYINKIYDNTENYSFKKEEKKSNNLLIQFPVNSYFFYLAVKVRNSLSHTYKSCSHNFFRSTYYAYECVFLDLHKIRLRKENEIKEELHRIY